MNNSTPDDNLISKVQSSLQTFEAPDSGSDWSEMERRLDAQEKPAKGSFPYMKMSIIGIMALAGSYFIYEQVELKNGPEASATSTTITESINTPTNDQVIVADAEVAGSNSVADNSGVNNNNASEINDESRGDELTEEAAAVSSDNKTIRREHVHLSSDKNDDSYNSKNPKHLTNGLIIPSNVFSPNGDGEKDVWEISGKGIVLINLEIRDETTGDLVYESTSFDQSWNGKLKDGSDAKKGFYKYKITYKSTDTNSEVQRKSNYLELVR